MVFMAPPYMNKSLSCDMIAAFPGHSFARYTTWASASAKEKKYVIWALVAEDDGDDKGWMSLLFLKAYITQGYTQRYNAIIEHTSTIISFTSRVKRVCAIACRCMALD